MEKETTKLELVMHYIIWKCQDPTQLGATKLNKILWYSDMHHYMESGKSITNVTYIKRQHGPVPNKNDFNSARESLVRSKKIAVTKDLYHGYSQFLFVALEKPDISSLSPDEVSIIDTSVEEICKNYTASSISERTHGMLWELAEIGEEIPLYAAFSMRFGEITEEDMKWAKEEANRLNMG